MYYQAVQNVSDSWLGRDLRATCMSNIVLKTAGCQMAENATFLVVSRNRENALAGASSLLMPAFA
jgi:uncharacterized protein YfiM (DUF2279 family)